MFEVSFFHRRMCKQVNFLTQMALVKDVICCPFSWASTSKAIDDHLVKLTDSHEKWKEYEMHINEVTNRVVDIEELVHSLPAAVVDGQTEDQPYIDKIHVCIV